MVKRIVVVGILQSNVVVLNHLKKVKTAEAQRAQRQESEIFTLRG
jgi:hypothetical protein